MNISLVNSDKFSFYYALILSVILHIILLILFNSDDTWVIFKEESTYLKNDENQMRFEIIETPYNLKDQEPLQKTSLLSDKNNRVSDVYNNKKQGALPFSNGEIKEKNLASRYREPEERGMGEINEQTVQSDFQHSENRQITGSNTSYFNDFSKDLLTRNRSKSSARSENNNQAHYNQTEISAQNHGGITFNTYNWDFAPYLLYLKERIQNNIYPPASFTRLGFAGENIIRFKIYPDGKLENPNVKGFKGSEALVETSMKAIEMSAPFRPLPEDFPENFLVVTAKFSYYLFSNN